MAKVYEFLANGFEEVEALTPVDVLRRAGIEVRTVSIMPGATNLNDHQGLRNLLVEHNLRHKKIAAICAAPLVLGGLGLLKDKKATCYPGFEKYLTGAEYTAELVTVDANITTGEGPAASFEFAYTLLRQIAGSKPVEEISNGMMYKHLEEKMKSE